MNTHRHSEIQAVTEELSKLLTGPVAIVLIGSVARNCATPRSDVDILVVGETTPTFKIRSPDFEFHPFDTTRFLTRLRNGDDFPNWCIRYGIPLAGRRYWESILHKGEDAIWPDWKRKITVAARRVLACQLSLSTEDKESAGESALFACDHLIRGLLLRERIFPLSRPELVQQIRPYAPQLGNCLLRLLHKSARNMDFRHVLSPLLGTLDDLDPELQRDYHSRLEEILSEAHTHTQRDSAGARQ